MSLLKDYKSNFDAIAKSCKLTQEQKSRLLTGILQQLEIIFEVPLSSQDEVNQGKEEYIAANNLYREIDEFLRQNSGNGQPA